MDTAMPIEALIRYKTVPKSKISTAKTAVQSKVTALLKESGQTELRAAENAPHISVLANVTCSLNIGFPSFKIPECFTPVNTVRIICRF